MSGEALLVLENIHARYVSKEILQGVSFEVQAGEVVALLGGNGAGKSTTLKVIAGLITPTRGRVIFRGQDITGLPPEVRQRLGIGYLMQGGRIFPNLTVDENLQIAKSMASVNDRSPAKNVDSATFFPELSLRKKSRAGLLSGGQRQMLAIEMVLSQRPLLCLLDEPSGALAATLADSFLHRISAEFQEAGRSLLLVEQNAINFAANATRTLVLDNQVLNPIQTQFQSNVYSSNEADREK